MIPSKKCSSAIYRTSLPFDCVFILLKCLFYSSFKCNKVRHDFNWARREIMQNQALKVPSFLIFILTLPALCGAAIPLDQNSAFNTGLNPQMAVFNIKDYGATGNKTDSAQAAIQKAIDACAEAGGGMVYVPPGEYSSGTIHLRSHVRFFVEAGATIYSIKDKNAFDKDALRIVIHRFPLLDDPPLRL